MVDKNIIDAVLDAKSGVKDTIQQIVTKIEKEEEKKRGNFTSWIFPKRDKIGVFKSNLKILILHIDKLMITSRDITYVGGKKISNRQGWKDMLISYKEFLDTFIADIKYYKQEDLDIVKDALNEYFKTLHKLSEEF